MFHVVGGPSVTSAKSPSSRSSAHAGLAKPIAVLVTAMMTAIARVIAIGRASHVSAEAGHDIAKVAGGLLAVLELGQGSLHRDIARTTLSLDGIVPGPRLSRDIC
jgi:hypothetical protein